MDSIMLGEDDIELTPRTMLEAGIKPPYHTPRFRAKDLTQDEAALHIQASWRVRQAIYKPNGKVVAPAQGSILLLEREDEDCILDKATMFGILDIEPSPHERGCRTAASHTPLVYSLKILVLRKCV